MRTCSAPDPLLALWHPPALDVLLGDGGATASTMGWVRTWLCATAEVLASILWSFTRSCNLSEDENLDRRQWCIVRLWKQVNSLGFKNAPTYDATCERWRRWDLQLTLLSSGHPKQPSPQVLRSRLCNSGLTVQSHTLSLRSYIYSLHHFFFSQA